MCSDKIIMHQHVYVIIILPNDLNAKIIVPVNSDLLLLCIIINCACSYITRSILPFASTGGNCKQLILFPLLDFTYSITS